MQRTYRTKSTDRSCLFSSRLWTLDSRLSCPRRRSGFTLIELMMVIIIIAILVAILVPAINGARIRARMAQVATEIKDLESGLTNFKSTYGIEPPSEITLYEMASQWNTANPDPKREAVRVRSRGLIRRMWPQFNFSASRDLNGSGKTEVDPDGDGEPGITLNGSECLLFFLGGLRDSTSGGFIGFSKNPTNPLSAGGGTREGPFIEIKGDRLSDVNGNSIPEYMDPLPSQTRPYIYASSYDGRGYRLIEAKRLGLNDFYREKKKSGPYFKPKSHQIISPGLDFENGLGGGITPGDANGMSPADQDNITNFHEGMLGK